MIEEIRELEEGTLKVKIYHTRVQMGEDAARDVCERIKFLLSTQPFVNIIFAAAPSQNEFLSFLSGDPEIPWERVNGFHMDEYVGLDQHAPQRFSQFLKERLFDRAGFHEVHYLDGTTEDPVAECRRYAALLRQYPVDIVCMGIGENAHLAFNDPHVADFNDPEMVKVVSLDVVSRQQQVNDECFSSLEEVPVLAITLTVPALLKARYIYCIVPGANKGDAVYHTLHGPVEESYPSTVLRGHKNAVLYLDKSSAERL